MEEDLSVPKGQRDKNKWEDFQIPSVLGIFQTGIGAEWHSHIWLCFSGSWRGKLKSVSEFSFGDFCIHRASTAQLPVFLLGLQVLSSELLVPAKIGMQIN